MLFLLLEENVIYKLKATVNIFSDIQETDNALVKVELKSTEKRVKMEQFNINVTTSHHNILINLFERHYIFMYLYNNMMYYSL